MKNRQVLFFLLYWSNFLLVFGLGLSFITDSFLWVDWLGVENSGLKFYFGGFFLLVSLIFFTPFLLSKNLKCQWLLITVFIFSFIDSFYSFVQVGYLPEQLIEHALKIFLPVTLFLILNNVVIRIKIILKILISLTFLGHGLFAIGIHSVPGGFMLMTTEILSFSADKAYNFLNIVGVLDIVFALTIFFNGIFYRIGIIYMVFWGFITALARIVYGVMIDSDGIQLLNYLSNFIYRLPHGMIPLILLVDFSFSNKKQLFSKVLKINRAKKYSI